VNCRSAGGLHRSRVFRDRPCACPSHRASCSNRLPPMARAHGRANAVITRPARRSVGVSFCSRLRTSSPGSPASSCAHCRSRFAAYGSCWKSRLRVLPGGFLPPDHNGFRADKRDDRAPPVPRTCGFPGATPRSSAFPWCVGWVESASHWHRFVSSPVYSYSARVYTSD